MSLNAFTQAQLPRFSEISPAQVEPKIRNIISDSQKTINTLLAQQPPFTWQNLMQPMEEMGDVLNQFWSAVSHMHAVVQTDELRKAYNDCIPLLTAYHTELSQNVDLYRAIVAISESKDFAQLSPAQKKIIENDIRDFKLSGIHLDAEKKAKVAELNQTLSQLTTKFSENLLDATQAWTLHLKDSKALAGLPEQAMQLAKDNAKQRGLEGYVLTLDYPSYSSGIRFLNDRALRKTLYEAYSTRASDCGPTAGKWDNSQIMNDILKTRHALAQILGFNTFNELSLATKMAKKPEEVMHFLQDLLVRSKPYAKKEYQTILKLAQKQDGLTECEAWDIPYYSEKLREATFDYSQEELRAYFPIDKVMRGLFWLVETLYGIKITRQEGVDVWHSQVEFYVIHDAQNQLRAGFYIDLYARPHKRDGAWMDECRVRRLVHNTQLQLPVAYLTCNFMPPVDGNPALLTQDDVLTLFHEFGHCLHHMLSKVDFPSVSGINGVPWDAVEFPSQFMENFFWEKETLAKISGHYKTGEPLPDELYQKMLAAKHFQTGLQMVRQLEFAIFDFRIHLEYDANKPNQIQSILDDVRKEASVIKAPAFNRFQHSFSHIFAGGYAAGYYSYKWAEVLSSDAYAQFEENHIFDRNTGRSFMENILEVGGVRDPMDSFVAFRGRKPTIDALLKHSGITAASDINIT